MGELRDGLIEAVAAALHDARDYGPFEELGGAARDVLVDWADEVVDAVLDIVEIGDE